MLGNYNNAQKFYQESLEIEKKLGEKMGIAQGLHNLGNLAYVVGNLDEAGRLYMEGLKIKQELGDKRSEAVTLHQIGMVAQDVGDLNEASRFTERASRSIRNWGTK